MHYFITSRIDSLTSAIELAEIKRLKLFTIYPKHKPITAPMKRTNFNIQVLEFLLHSRQSKFIKPASHPVNS